MADLQFLPSLGMTGLYTIKAPFNELTLGTTQYTCTGIETLAGAINRGDDPYTDIYEAVGAAQTDFDNDVADGAYLITIESGVGDSVVFPSSALVSMPDSDGVIYRNVVLSVSLSAIPDDLDTSVLSQQMADLVRNALGVASTVYLTQVGGITVLSQEQHAAIEAARQENVTSLSSPIYENELLRTQVTSMTQKIQVLEAYIAQHFADVAG